jgi:hypothetical protein
MGSSIIFWPTGGQSGKARWPRFQIGSDTLRMAPIMATSHGDVLGNCLTGKLTGNFADSGTPPRILRPISEAIQQLTAKFPTQRNREFLEA